jgi:hypothetical protein
MAQHFLAIASLCWEYVSPFFFSSFVVRRTFYVSLLLGGFKKSFHRGRFVRRFCDARHRGFFQRAKGSDPIELPRPSLLYERKPRVNVSLWLKSQLPCEFLCGRSPATHAAPAPSTSAGFPGLWVTKCGFTPNRESSPGHARSGRGDAEERLFKVQ